MPYWPSSLGKDALVVFALGGAVYFAARTLEAFELRWLVGLAAFITIVGLIRIHVAGLVVIAPVGAGVIGRARFKADPRAVSRRRIVLAGFAGAGVLVVRFLPDIFGVDLAGAGSLDTFTADVVRRTSESGTVAAGGAVTGLADLPGAIALVLFRPYVIEASEIQHYFAALETTLVLGLTIWRLPTILRNWRMWRSNAYVVFCTFYFIGFAIAFSVVRNLGIIARQRGQVLALFLVVLVILGWEEKKTTRRLQASTSPPVNADSK